jgi:2-dehydropantoate 2-reductase
VRHGPDASALSDREVVLVTVKSLATAEAGEALARVLPASCAVVSFQNGVRNAQVLRGALPGSAVLAGMVPFNVVRLGGGRFHNGTSGPLELERAGGVEGPLRRALVGAGFSVVLHDDLARVQWSKLCVNVNNAVNALSGLPLREQLAQRPFRRIMAALTTEALACMRAAGLKPTRIGRLHPALGPLVLPLPDWLFLRLARALVTVDPTARSSMWEDLERRRPTEIDHLNGEVVRLGALHGVPAPLNARVRALILEAERRAEGSPGMSARALEDALRVG